MLALALALTTAACGGGGGPAVSDDDVRLGAEQHPRLLAEFGGAYASEEARYVARVGARLAEVAGLGGRCTFTLVNSDVVNAFAVPGCYIYVTRGLLGIVNSEGELASVLAHELGHITANHSGRQQQRSVLRQLGVIAVGIVTESPRLTEMAGAAAGLFDLRYSRKHEYEADDLGLATLQEAGYDPYASADMLGVLQRQADFQARLRGGGDEAQRMPEWALTHPLTQNRIARALAAAKDTGVAPDAMPEYEARYLGEIDGLLYGDDPQQGFINGSRFAHPVMRIAFTAPPGFTLSNSPAAVLIDGPDGLRGQFSGAPLPAGGLQAYAEAVLQATLGNTPARIVSAEPANANNTRAFLVQARVSTAQGEVPISLAAYQGEGGQAYHFLVLSKPGSTPPAGLAELFGSFRLLSTGEAAGLRPRFIRVLTVGRGETVWAVASRMAAPDPLATFLMLNGRDAAQPLRAGERVKLVVEAPR